jgi:hypothetical protein
MLPAADLEVQAAHGWVDLIRDTGSAGRDAFVTCPIDRGERKRMSGGGNRAWRQAAVAILIGVAVAVGLGYGGIWPQASPGATGVQLRHVLLVWSGFPVDASPRPLVLSGTRVDPPPGGFPTKAEGSAFASGAIAAPSAYPTAPRQADDFRLISPADAVGILRSPGATGRPLQVVSIRLGVAVFQTDRGPRHLPAWMVLFAGVPTPAAVEAPQIFPDPAGVATTRPAISGALLGQDDRTLTVIFTPSARGCGQSYELRVETSRSAVAVAVVRHGTRTLTCLTPRRLVTVLGKPLGGRVLVDGSTGAPITVTMPRLGVEGRLTDMSNMPGQIGCAY